MSGTKFPVKKHPTLQVMIFDKRLYNLQNLFIAPAETRATQTNRNFSFGIHDGFKLSILTLYVLIGAQMLIHPISGM
jgi:hypothetical protein